MTIIFTRRPTATMTRGAGRNQGGGPAGDPTIREVLKEDAWLCSARSNRLARGHADAFAAMDPALRRVPARLYDPAVHKISSQA